MQRDRIPFERPVSIRDAGRGNTVRHVKTVNGASEVLTDWPHARRGPVYQETVARSAFEAFARHAEVLVAD